MSELNREQIIKNLERLVDKYGENGSYNTYCTLSDTLALIKGLTEENEKFRYEHEKLIEERDTFREYAYNMQKYVENIRHKEEEGYEPSAARYAAEMDMWRMIALRENKLVEEIEELKIQLLSMQRNQYDKGFTEGVLAFETYLKEHSFTCDPGNGFSFDAIDVDELDDYVKEFLEE
jgi:hypothetical protein